MGLLRFLRILSQFLRGRYESIPYHRRSELTEVIARVLQKLQRRELSIRTTRPTPVPTCLVALVGLP